MESRNWNGVRETMKTRLLRIAAGVIAAAITAAVVAQVSLSAHEEDTAGIEGAWDVKVTIRQCDTGDPLASIHAMNMFIKGGTLTETSNDLFRGSSLGTWSHAGGRRYAAVFRFFTYNQDGSFFGRNRITRTIRLSADGKGFVASAIFDVMDADDKVVASGCATETARRFED